MRIWKTLLSTAVIGLVSGLAVAQAQEMSDTFRDPALDAMKGKTIAYLPISLGFDMAQAWGGVVKEEAAHYGREELQNPDTTQQLKFDCELSPHQQNKGQRSKLDCQRDQLRRRLLLSACHGALEEGAM